MASFFLSVELNEVSMIANVLPLGLSHHTHSLSGNGSKAEQSELSSKDKASSP